MTLSLALKNAMLTPNIAQVYISSNVAFGFAFATDVCAV